MTFCTVSKALQARETNLIQAYLVLVSADDPHADVRVRRDVHRVVRLARLALDGAL